MSIIFYAIHNFIIHILRRYVNPTIGKVLFLVGVNPHCSGAATTYGVDIESCGYFNINDPDYYCGRYLFPIPHSWYRRYAKIRFPDKIYC